MVDVEGVSTDLSERLGIELFAKTFYRTGRSVAAVHPAIKGQYERARFEPDGVIDLEEIVSRSAHASSIRVLQCFTKCGVPQNAAGDEGLAQDDESDGRRDFLTLDV
tara:strand:- start:224 stop:544 length:321 start_codon:yes stop_codon:yes gene_type:complete